MSDTDNLAPTDETPMVVDKEESVGQSKTGELSNETPEVTQGNDSTQEVEAPETKTEDKGVEEKLFAGTFKSVDELEKSYSELRTKSTKDAQEKAELTRVLNEVFAAPEPQGTETDGYDQEESDLANQRVEALERKSAVQSFILSHSDADPVTMQKVLSEDPLVSQISGHEAKLEYAYLRSQSLSSKQAIAEAEKRGATQTQAKIAEKQVAQVESASSAEQVDEKSELKNKAMTGNPDERKSARLEYIKKHLTNI